MEDIKNRTIELIDNLKATCQQYGMSNDGNEYKIITQVFLYKFLNDKFGYEIKKLSPKLAAAKEWEIAYKDMDDEERLTLLDRLSPDIPKLYPEHLIYNLWNQQNRGDFDLFFDNTMIDIANVNIDIFSTQTTLNTHIPLFEGLTQYVTDESDRAKFAKALVDKLANFSFEDVFGEHYDFFATIFEYLIKDYNTAGGGKYAEYYTPHFIATIMAKLIVGKDKKDCHNVECYDPAVGTGTLLMALAHEIGENKCTIFSQDISQKSNKMLKLNLILNGLVASLDHAIQGDTLTTPYHRSNDGKDLRQFDFIVCNPPFNIDFSDTQKKLAEQKNRFWAGVPNIPPKKKDSMSIYTCFIQHILNSLKENGKAAIVVPSGFLTAQYKKLNKNKVTIEGAIKQKIIDNKWLKGVILMPTNVFAYTGTSVSVLFIDKSVKNENVLLIDASNLGTHVKVDNKQKTLLNQKELDKIVNTFMENVIEPNFSVSVSCEQIKNKNYSLLAGKYFDVEIERIQLSKEEFNSKIQEHVKNLDALYSENQTLEKALKDTLKRVKYE